MLLTVLAAMALASGDGQAAANAPAADPAAAAPEKKICRTIERTGSIMGGTRTCHTKAQWAAIDQANNDHAAAGRDLKGQGGNRQGGGLN